MAVQVQTTFNEYTANGVATEFPFTFKILQDGDLKVYENEVEVSLGFTIDGAGEEAGGTVIYVDPPESGTVITLRRVLTLDRSNDYQEGGGLSSSTLDADFDRIVMMIQDTASSNPEAASYAALADTSASAAAAAAAASAADSASSASDAAASATSAAASATSASTASTHATNAANSATAAATSATNAAASESTVAASASAAATSETNAATSETNAATSATNAATSASNAATSETNAASSASAAATSASNASTSATNAASSATDAAASYDSFDDRYLGAKASAPTLDNDGDALITGALYYNTTVSAMQVYNGTGWDDVGSATTMIYEFVATAGQTTFSGTDVNGKGLTYNAGFELVMVNGVRYGSDLYTATSGSSVVFDTGLTADDKVTVVAFGTFSVADTYTQTQADATFAPITRSRKNYIINGNFDIWQRATSQTSSGYGSVDRWSNDHSGSTKTTSRQTFTLGQTDVPNNPTYYSRTVVSSVAGSGNYVNAEYRVEDVTKTSGKTVTLSFWAKADASKNVAVEFSQRFGSGGSPSAAVNGISVTTCNLTTGWQKFSVTVDLPSVSGKTLGTDNNDYLQLAFWFDAGSTHNARTNSLGNQSGTFDIAQVQLEEGSVATDFEYRTIGEELALCQRYYEKSYPDDKYPGESSPAGAVSSVSTSTGVAIGYRFTIRKRGVPTVTTYSYNGGSSNTVWAAGASRSVASQFPGQMGVFYITSANLFTAGSHIWYHWTADAEL